MNYEEKNGRGVIADLFHRIEGYRSERRSYPVLEVNKSLGGEAREPMMLSRDNLIRVNIGSNESPKYVFVSDQLSGMLRISLVSLLVEYKDCFAWDYTEMPGLDRKLVEYRLPLLNHVTAIKQAPRRLSPEVIEAVHKEVKKLFKAGYIRTTKYVEWLSSIAQ